MANWLDEWKERGIPEAEWPVEHENPAAKVIECHRATAEERRVRGSPRFEIYTLGLDGEDIAGVHIDFVPDYARGIAFDHADIWGVTIKERGLKGLYFQPPEKPMVWNIFVEGCLVLSNVRFDLGNEYMPARFKANRPVNTPGNYVYRIKFEMK